MAEGHGSGRPIAVYGAVVANLGIAVVKFIAAAITGSSAMLSEGIHSVVDTGNQLLLLVGIRQSHRPPDEFHEFGHGKELYFWSLIVAIVLFGIGGGLAFYEGISHILDPHPLESPIVAYVVLAISFALEASSWTIAMRELRAGVGGEGSLRRRILSSKDPSVVTVLLEDTAALLGLIAAFGGILLAQLTGDTRFDGLGSIVIGGVLTVVAVFLAYESRGLLVGERADVHVVNRIRHVLLADAGVKEIVDLRTMHLGPNEILVNAQVRLNGSAAAEAVATIARVKHQLQHADVRLDYITIEPVPPAPAPVTEADQPTVQAAAAPTESS
jgi:cation diffusion facilitator family transporter